MKLYKPNKAEWMTFCVLVIFLVAALNYIFFGRDFLKKEILLISYPLLIFFCLISWYLHVVAQDFVRGRFKGIQKSFKRLFVLEVVHFIMTAASFMFFFWLYDHYHLFGYQFHMRDYWMSLLIAITLSAIATAVWESYFIFKNYQQSMLDKEHLQRITYQEELNALKSQVNPHFLFNSLNSLSSLIGDDSEKAEQFLDEMSKVYRYLLRNNDVELTNLETELKFIRSFSHLLKTRYGDGFQFRLDISPEYEEYLLAPLTLQLLVENAVKHNVTLKDKPLVVSVTTDAEDNLIVQNNLQRKAVSAASTKIGLKNIVDRYKLLNRGEVRIVSDEQYFTVIIPLIKPESVTAGTRNVALG